MITTTARTQHPALQLRRISESIRAQALFASMLQPSQSPSAGQVHAAVTATLQRLGAGNCAALLAGEFGDRPECAASRMTWALATVRAAYRRPDDKTRW